MRRSALSPIPGRRTGPLSRWVDGIIPIALLLLSALVLTGAQAVEADDGVVRIKRLRVSVLPEYDEPRMLAIYQGELEGVRSFPAAVRFRLPRGAEVRETCALRQPGDEHLCQLFTTEAAGDDLLVVFPTHLPAFFMEFYYGGVRGETRSFDYAFRSEGPVGRLDLVVQHPLRSSDFTVMPAATSVSEDQRGFMYHHYSYHDLAPGQQVQVKIGYRKADLKPSVSKKNAEISPAPQSDGRADLLIVGGLFATAAVVAALYLAMDRLSRRPVIVVRSAEAIEDAVDGRPARVCTTCGHGLSVDVASCARCGANLDACGESSARRSPRP